MGKTKCFKCEKELLPNYPTVWVYGAGVVIHEEDSNMQTKQADAQLRAVYHKSCYGV